MTAISEKIKDVIPPRALYESDNLYAPIVGYRVIVEYETGAKTETLFDAKHDGERIAHEKAKQLYAEKYLNMCIQRSAPRVANKR